MLRQSQAATLEERFLDFVYQPIRDEHGKVTHIFVQGSDVTERVRAETHQRLLLNELNHRVKNTLASVQSIVSQTLRGIESKEEAAVAVTARIVALSRAHNVLTEENWDSADIHTIVESSLAAFQHAGRQAIQVNGPRMRVGPQAALSIALALHELATNAVKYGALSVAEGIVDLNWTVGTDDEFKLVWTERSGPPAAKSERQGFGSRLILRVLPHELRGSANMEYRPGGVVFTLLSTLEAIRDRPQAS